MALYITQNVSNRYNAQIQIHASSDSGPGAPLAAVDRLLVSIAHPGPRLPRHLHTRHGQPRPLRDGPLLQERPQVRHRRQPGKNSLKPDLQTEIQARERRDTFRTEILPNFLNGLKIVDPSLREQCL